MKQFVADYLTFTKKERRGIYFLLAMLLMLMLGPKFFHFIKSVSAQKNDSALVNQLAQLSATIDSGSKLKTGNYALEEDVYKGNRFVDFAANQKEYTQNREGDLFIFDPNTLDIAGWQRLGVREKTALTIQNYISKGGRFKVAEDIGKIYGLNTTMVQRLLPYVQIDNTTANTNMGNLYKDSSSNAYTTNVSEVKNTYTKTVKTYDVSIDINTADTTAWKRLPGIGSGLSSRIVNYRNKLGGFIRIAQISETYGLPDSTFQKIKNSLFCNPNGISKVNINATSIEQLKHPYISKAIANNILQYRNQHGKYTSIADLRKLALVDDIWLQKITPYLTVE
jgi:competence protein ComEA